MGCSIHKDTTQIDSIYEMFLFFHFNKSRLRFISVLSHKKSIKQMVW